MREVNKERGSVQNSKHPPPAQTCYASLTVENLKQNWETP